MADVHDSVARSTNPAEASTRPSDTTAFELRLMVRDVLRKLALAESSLVVEVGCGTGIFATPVARVAARYVGLDFASGALEVLHEQLERERPRADWELIGADFLDADLSALAGQFDRALMYAVLHYARSDSEGIEFLRRLVSLLRPGGRALVGNLPVADLAGSGPQPPDGPGPGARINALRRWTQGSDPFGRSRGWRTRSAVLQAAKGWSAGLRGASSFETVALPAGFTVELTCERIEGWLAEIPHVTHRWLLPAAGTPMHLGRLDLLVGRG